VVCLIWFTLTSVSSAQVSIYNGSVPFAGATLAGSQPAGCTPNEIYIVDGDRTVVLTNKAISADIEYVQQETINLRDQIKNQNEVIDNLKRQLDGCQKAQSDITKHREMAEIQHTELVVQLNKTMEAVDKMVKENQELLDERNKERESRIHFESENKKLAFKINEMANEFKKLSEVAKEDTTSKILYDQCQVKLRAKSAIIESFKFHAENNIHQKECTTTLKYNNQCPAVRQELLLQDQTIYLLKNHIKDQATTLNSVNRLLLAKHNMMINVTDKLHSRLNATQLEHDEIGNFEKMLETQQEVIRLLGAIGSYNTYLRDARDTALKILQETVYKMVANIDECRNAAVEGLQNRLQLMQDHEEPLNKMIKSLRGALDKAQELQVIKNEHEQRIDDILDTRNHILQFVKRWSADIAEFSNLAEKLKCNVDMELMNKLDSLYKPVNSVTCASVCKKQQDPQQPHYGKQVIAEEQTQQTL